MIQSVINDPLSIGIAKRLKHLRQARGWSLDAAAQQTGVSRATLSRLENADVSPTTRVLGLLSAAYGVTASRLLAEVEGEPSAVIRRADQTVWCDPDSKSGLIRRMVSPPSLSLRGEVVEVELQPGACISYPSPAKPGLEHHLVLLHGILSITVDNHTHTLRAGDVVRYHLFEANQFETPPETGARYLLFLI